MSRSSTYIGPRLEPFLGHGPIFKPGYLNSMITPTQYLNDVLSEALDVKARFFSAHKDRLNFASVVLAAAVKSGGKVLALGNGGSAADAQHFAAEMTGRMLVERNPLPAIALTTDTSALTAIGNDYGFDKVFSRQVQALGKSGDVLVAISTSGNSPNVIEAVKAAIERDLVIIGLTGEGGGQLAKLLRPQDFLFMAESRNTCRIQETHIFALHVLVDLMDRFH